MRATTTTKYNHKRPNAGDVQLGAPLIVRQNKRSRVTSAAPATASNSSKHKVPQVLRPASFLGLPQELRDMMWQLLLPSPVSGRRIVPVDIRLARQLREAGANGMQDPLKLTDMELRFINKQVFDKVTRFIVRSEEVHIARSLKSERRESRDRLKHIFQNATRLSIHMEGIDPQAWYWKILASRNDIRYLNITIHDDNKILKLWRHKNHKARDWLRSIPFIKVLDNEIVNVDNEKRGKWLNRHQRSISTLS